MKAAEIPGNTELEIWQGVSIPLTCRVFVATEYGFGQALGNPQPSDSRKGLEYRSVTVDIDRIVLLQIAEQREILDKNPMRRRVPARIDDEDVKARCSGRFVRLASRRLPGLGPRLDDVAFLPRGRHLRRRCRGGIPAAVGVARAVDAGAAASLRASTP